MEKTVTVAVPVPHKDASIGHYQGKANIRLMKEHPTYKTADALGWQGCEEATDGQPVYLYAYRLTF